MARKLRKGAFCTDIHFGKKSNSPLHNEDCLRYLDWFCEQVRNDPSIDYIGFLGDWNENRSAINIATINYSYQGAKKLNALGLPVYFVVGNHDLYHRHTREIHSIAPFNEFSNFTIIDQPVIIKEIGDGALFSPYLFHDEYPDLGKHLELPFWAGHFEFKGFKITGYNVIMPTGPDPLTFAGPKRILSGHFHQRQTQGNITYIGNTFPMDFGDAGDFTRGMATYDHVLEKMSFTDWADCPKYLRVKLSKMLDPDFKLPEQARVKCVLDNELSFEDGTVVREEYMKQFNLRELVLEETNELDDVLSNTETTATDSVTGMATLNDINTVDQLVIQMLTDIKSDKIDAPTLVEQYKRLV
jgi:DNA repair exonuclease SbcCD nuclease subunit